eukprot:gene5585-6148_t
MLNYNCRLQPMSRKGLCGDQEMIEDDHSLDQKIDELSTLLLTSQHCVVFTGAGISTSAGIADFRGPNGIWTRELRGESFTIQENSVNVFNHAKPTLTHFALMELTKRGLIHHIISQNVDGLHLKSGLDIDKLSELHGNIFMEICDTCHRRYLREKDVGGMGCKPTGKLCDNPICQGQLTDFAIDWDTELPSTIFSLARRELRQADLVICIGTSLRIQPAGNMPLTVLRTSKVRDKPGKLVIINLQKTHLDKTANLRIHHYCDEVMKRLCQRLEIDLQLLAKYKTIKQKEYPPLPSLSSLTKKKKKKRTWSEQQQQEQQQENDPNHYPPQKEEDS